jgi:cytochrome c-type biogenesis protein
MADITVPGVFLAGLVSFLSPCVLPLVPPYLTFLAGSSLDEITGDTIDKAVRRRAVTSALFFMAGLATVFISLGATASLVGGLLLMARRTLAGWLVDAANAGLLPMGWATSIDPFSLLAGIIIIAMGLHFLGVFRIAMLYRQARFESHTTPGPLGAYLMGLAFAFGWTPCIGPVLGAILGIAASRETVGAGAGLLAVYSLGLAIPFWIAAGFSGAFMRFLSRFRRHLGTVERIMGGLLVLTGLAFIFGYISDMAIWFQQTFPILMKIG